MVVSSAVEHIFNETAIHASWSKSDGKERVKENNGKSNGKSKGSTGAKGSYKGKTSKTGLSGLD